MLRCLCAFAAAGWLAVLGGCASPYFVHDPQIGFFSREQVPDLLKSLRCELATYAAANNQRHMIFAALAEMHQIDDAIAQYPYFELDPGQFGGVSLNLKLQDSFSVGDGTAFDWKRTAADGVHNHFWHIGPSLGSQSTYEANLAFLMPQDVYGFSPAGKFEHGGYAYASDGQHKSYSCFNDIQRRAPAFDEPLYNDAYAYQDLEALATGKDPDTAIFSRIRVNGTTPLAQWLLEMNRTTGSAWLVRSDAEANGHMPAGQMAYTFTIQTSGGLDVKYSAATSLWPVLGGDASTGLQHTGTLTLILNGLDAAATGSVQGGNTDRTDDVPIGPPKTRKVKTYCPLPVISRRPEPRSTGKYCFWVPPRAWQSKMPVVAKSHGVKNAAAISLRQTAKVPMYVTRKQSRATLKYSPALVPLRPARQ